MSCLQQLKAEHRDTLCSLRVRRQSLHMSNISNISGRFRFNVNI